MLKKFFLPMKIPSVTAQQKKITVRNGRPVVYEDARLKDARDKFTCYLWQHRPEKPMEGAIFLHTEWMYPATKKNPAGKFKTTKPDTDNLIKLFKDCMTKTGFWRDDAQVVYEVTSKQYADHPGIYVYVADVDSDNILASEQLLMEAEI